MARPGRSRRQAWREESALKEPGPYTLLLQQLRRERESSGTSSTSSSETTETVEEKPLEKGRVLDPVKEAADSGADSGARGSLECVVEQAAANAGEPLHKGSVLDVVTEAMEGAAGAGAPADTPAALVKGEDEPAEQNMPVAGTAVADPLKKGTVMVDYHLTLEVVGSIPPSNCLAMEKLLDQGYEVVICSYCFQRREVEVRTALSNQPRYDRLDNLLFTRARTGAGGKGEMMQAVKARALFDDHPGVLQEGLGLGLDVYAIRTRWEGHRWAAAHRPHGAPGSVQVCSTFAEAVAAWLLLEEMRAEI